MPKKKKILFVITKSSLGGAGKYVYDLSTQAHTSYDVAVAAGEEGDLFTALTEAKVRTISIPFLERDISFIKELRVFFFLISLFIKEKPDVVHLNSPKIGGIGGLAARVAGIEKIIYTAHGWAFHEDRSPIQKTLIKFTSWIIVLLSTKTIAVSHFDEQAFDDWFMVKNKMMHIANGVDDKETYNKDTARDTLKKYQIPFDKPIVGTVAELHRNKGLSYLLYAAEKIPDASFVIIGEGEERKSLEKIIEEKNLNDRVYLLGDIRPASPLIAGFDIFVLPSVKEGFPYALLEAGLQGVPIIATRVGGIPDLIEHGKNGLLIDSKDKKTLVTSVKRLIENESMASKYGESLKKRVAQEFNQKQMVQKTFDLYV